MNSKECVARAFKKKQGLPDRVPIQFDLCKQLIESFGKELKIVHDYAHFYYEDLTYAPAHIIQADVSPATVKVMIKASKEFGFY